MPTNPDCWLVAAVTGRALAASARRGGHEVVVLDCFADRDTRRYARACRAVVGTGVLRFDHRALLAAARELAPPGACAGLVHGAGFEAHPDLLERLAEGRPLFGNPAAVIRAVKDPQLFFPLLDRLGLAHPEIRLEPPADPRGWLLKRAGGAGGTHVRRATRRALPPRGYFQRFEEGQTLSALFLADGARARLLGISEQWVADHDPARPYLYGGAVSHVPITDRLHREVAAGVDALVAATGLRGLNGVDFLLQDDRWLVLEVNPRPTATVELYDPDYSCGLFDWHLRAVAGDLPAAAAPRGHSRAQAIVIAPAAWQVSQAFEFPGWCRDLPPVGSTLRPGDPVCTVFAEGSDLAGARELVRLRQQELRAALASEAECRVAP